MTRACRPLTAWRRRAVPLCAAALLVPGPASADTCSGLSLGLPSLATTGGPSAVAVGDFDRDGRLDVAAASQAASSLSVFLGNGGGGLTLLASTPSAPGPTDVVAGDLDRDGRLDLLVASGSSTGVSVHQGLAGGSFAAGTSSDVGVVPARLALGDFDRDGRLDLVVVGAASHRIRVFRGQGTMSFVADAVLADLDLSATGPGPAAAVPGDFNRDGRLDLAVAQFAAGRADFFLGNGAGALVAGPSVVVGTGPRDLFAGDVDRNGWLDVVVANETSGEVSVLLGREVLGSWVVQPASAVPVTGQPVRVALADLDRDGALDLVALDAAAPRIAAFEGGGTPPAVFGSTPYPAALAAAPRGLALGDFTSDARADVVTALPSTNEVAVVSNQSGWPCARSSFAAAPRSYSVTDGPVATAAADFDNDGRVDLAVATAAGTDAHVRVRRSVAGGFASLADFGPFTSPPRGLAAADLDFDGQTDLVAALGNSSSGRVQLILHDPGGALSIGPSHAAGTNTAAVAIGDFDGNGAPDVAAVSEGSGGAGVGVWVFLGNGTGAFVALAGNPLLSGLTTPRALVAADLTGDGLADLAIAESGASAVHVLRSNGGSPPTFTLITPAGTGLPVGAFPEGIAAARLDADGWPDLVTGNASGTVSVIRRTGSEGFLAAETYPVVGGATAVALADLAGDSRPDIAVTAGTGGDPTLRVLVNDGTGLFPTSSDHPVRRYPRAITPFDADADGRPDLAIACQNADAVVVLLSRSPGPFGAAPAVDVGAAPRAAVAADLDGDGDPDLAVANHGENTVSLLRNDVPGGLAVYGAIGVGAGPESIVAADFNRDGRVDLALSSPLATPSPGVSILLGSATPPPGQFEGPTLVAVGSVPGALAVGDFDRDGDPDLAVADKVSGTGYVRVLLGNGNGGFSAGAPVPVGDQPAALVAADFDRDGDLDLAVGNEGADNVQILLNAAGSFSVSQTLALPGTDRDPRALAAGDFDADGAVDLAVSAYGGDRLHVYRNLGTGTFAVTPGSLDVPTFLESVTVADVNLDGRPDLLAVAQGLTVFRGEGGMAFAAPETVLVGRMPRAAVVADFTRDGWPDAAVVNEGTTNVSVLASSACQARRLEVALHPAACETGAPPYGPAAEVRAHDEGGNLAACAAGTVVPSIVPGTGDPLAVLGGSGLGGLPLTNGVASFTGLTIDRPGRRYRLRFSLGALPLARTRSFTLGPELQVVGTPSICPSSSATFATEGSYDQYAWTLTPPVVPSAYTPTVTLFNPPVQGAHTLGVSARVDGCYAQRTVSVYGGNLVSTSLAIGGLSSVCVDCIGGTIVPTDVGGGPTRSRQWGYRVVSGGAITPLPGESGGTYTLKGASFPGPGSYLVVVTTTPTCGSTQVSTNEVPVTVLTAVPSGEVQYVAASSRGTAAGGRNDLQWVNSTTAAEEVLVRWNKAPDGSTLCVPPSGPASSADGEESKLPSTGTRDGYAHTGLALDTAYCYSVFVRRSTAWSPGRTVKARPFNADAGPVKWAYSTGATAVVPPVVGYDGILVMSNDQTVHALTRGGAPGGFWPSRWVPGRLTGVAHSRSPVVPFGGTSAVFPGRSILFAGDDVGDVHAVDAATGQAVWPARPQDKPVVGAPGGLFTQWGGVADLIVVGTRDTSLPNELRGLAVADGTLVGSPFTAGGTIGPISGSPATDSTTQRAYFASRSRSGGSTIWCVRADGSTPFTLVWSRNLGDVDGSPVLRNGRVYFGTTTGVVYSLDAATGLDARTFTTGDGPVKGFVFPDRRNDDLLFATNTWVWSLSDTGTGLAENWRWTDPVNGLSPSVVLYRPNTNYVYVGSSGGRLYELEFVPEAATPPTARGPVILGDGNGQVGAPTLDIGVEPPDVTPGKKVLVVGSESGVVYGVEVPF